MADRFFGIVDEPSRDRCILRAAAAIMAAAARYDAHGILTLNIDACE
ncbi:hypothetical protein [Singulisphaera sp. PoT]